MANGTHSSTLYLPNPLKLGLLALIGIAWVATILVQRWRWKASEDPYLLAITWAGAITLALPRLVSAGPGLAEFTVGGSLMLTLGSVYFLSGLIFLGLRASAEANA